MFNERIRLLRKTLGLTLKEMSGKLGIPLSTLSKYEQDVIKPGVEILSRIASAYNVNLNWLLTGLGDMFIDSAKAKEIVEFLTEMSSQNNRGTAFPYYYTIADENARYENDKFSGDCIMYDGHIWDAKDFAKERDEELIDKYKKVYSYDDEDDFDIDSFIENELEGEDLYNGRFRKELDTYYEGVFLTETDAKQYLESASNHHFGPNPRTYVKCMASWGRHTLTEEFFKKIFQYFGVKIPPELYYENKKSKELVEA